VVGGERKVVAGPSGGDDIEVGKGGFHHDDVGAFGNVEVDLAQRFAAVVPVLLVGPAVTAAGDGDVDRVAEGTVEG
jgi:hypothetical protein